MNLTTAAFPEFFTQLWPDRTPFPWQQMLAERGIRGEWPEVINLPTASGKTACLDAALFALAATAHIPDPQLRMPRRIWFVVDRRIVVDEAFERAQSIAQQLAGANDGPLAEVASRLRDLSGVPANGGKPKPLAVSRLRGGAWRDDSWARLPSQPAVICSTVDQVGSSLLFRSYGHGDRTASIYAGLCANDSLIILDEAHCAVPFLQTLRGVAGFRGEKWAEEPISWPFRFTIMSATPPADVPPDRMFPTAEERSLALDHPLLRQRFIASKPAELVTTKNTELVAEAAKRARRFVEQGCKTRVAVMVNRVATAEDIFTRLTAQLGEAVRTVLLTGRMRPLDRDELVTEWSPLFKAGSRITPEKPTILVTTQCLEVGADFSFDALVTECASLDALRQRFGRLNRLGDPGETPAEILIRERDTKEPKEKEFDPVYGKAIYETWKWLNDAEQKRPDGKVDFGVVAMETAVGRLSGADRKRFPGLLAPTSDAPVLLPAHLDLLCQTSPRPVPEPDVALFLHGKGNRTVEVRVVFRGDFPLDGDSSTSEQTWTDLLSVLPPVSPEMLTVPLHRLRKWLVSADSDADSVTDVQGALEPSEEGGALDHAARTHMILWRGIERSKLTRDAEAIRPNDIVVLPAALGMSGLGQTLVPPKGLGENGLDLAEPALRRARGLVVLRLQPELSRTFIPPSLTQRAVELMNAEDADRDDIAALLEDWAKTFEDDNLPEAIEVRQPPDWLKENLKLLVKDGFTMERHPLGGCILTGKKRRPPANAASAEEPAEDDEDFTSLGNEPVELLQHTKDVRAAASDFMRRCLGEKFAGLAACAAEGHDLGKLDPRFQLLLHNGDELAAAGAVDQPLAKSPNLPRQRRRRLQIRDHARLPEGFRHEFHSLQIVEQLGLTPSDPVLHDLTLHLIASHHGHARPFAPVVPDTKIIDALSLRPLGIEGVLTSEERNRLAPAHRLDSGVSKRFWRLTRRFGWWGLAYIEAVFRLSDWFTSSQPGYAVIPSQALVGGDPSSKTQTIAPTLTETPLDALDGSNPLGFLAALGTLRILATSSSASDYTLHWTWRVGGWRPVLGFKQELRPENIVDLLYEHGLNLAQLFDPVLLAAAAAASPKNKKGEASWKDKLNFPIPSFRAFCRGAIAEPNRLAEFAATWAGETAPSEKDDLARKTRFDFTAGQQAFIGMVRDLKQNCSKDDLHHALFDGWCYSQLGTSMRWDPADEKRQYALQAVDPTNNSENPPLAVAGANFLALEALPLFPVVPDRKASQPGFANKGRRPYWYWPVWSSPLTLDEIRSLLVLALADPDRWPPERRNEIGIPAVFESAIVQPSGRYRCFTPSRTL